MTILNATPGWDPVLQLETDTPALGGPGGPMNAQAQALLNNIAMLRQGYVKGVSSVSDLRAVDKTTASFAYIKTNGLTYALDPADTTSTDSGTYVIVGADGGRWKLLMSGVPFSPDLIDGQIEIIAGALRQDTTDRTKWNVISDSLHQALGVSGLVATASGSQLTLNYSGSKSKVIYLNAGPDETFANAFGMSIGASVGNSFAVFKASIDLTLAAEIYWDGVAGAWQVSTGAGQGTGPGVSVPPNVQITGVSYASGTLNIAHTLLPGKDIHINPFNTRSGAILAPYVAGLKSFSDTGIAVHFMDPTTGQIITAASPSDKMTTLISKHFRGGIVLDGTGGTSAYRLDLGNIWFYGIMRR